MHILLLRGCHRCCEEEGLSAIPPPPRYTQLSLTKKAAGLGEWRASLPTPRVSARKHTTKQPSSRHPELCTPQAADMHIEHENV